MMFGSSGQEVGCCSRIRMLRSRGTAQEQDLPGVASSRLYWRLMEWALSLTCTGKLSTAPPNTTS